MTNQEKQLQGAVYNSALAAAQAGPKPTYAGTFEGQLNDIFNKIQNREPFSYDVNEDPLYQSYKDQYIQNGKLAMKDTIGQAAALTGGYGNTYGQQVGQQAYNAYLQNLAAVIPELYDRAYGMYKDQGDDLKDQFALAGAMRDDEYGRYRDDMGDWDRDRAIAIDREQEDYNRRMEAEKIAYQKEQDDYNRRASEQADAYKRQQQAYSNLLAMIKSSGYMPSTAELAAAGMSPAQAGAMRDEYNRQVAAEQAAAALAARETEARIFNYYNKAGTGGSGGGSGGSGGGSGGSGGGSGGRGGYSGGDWLDDGADGLWVDGTWVSLVDDVGSGGSYYDQVKEVAVEMAKDAGTNRTAGAGSVYNGSTGTAPIIEAVMSNSNLSASQKATIREEVVNTANANVNRSAMGSPTAYYTPGVNMGGTGADQYGKVVSSKPVQDYTKRR